MKQYAIFMIVASFLIVLTTACQSGTTPAEVENTALPQSTVESELNSDPSPTATVAKASATTIPSASPTLAATATLVVIEPESGKSMMIGRAISVETTTPLTNTIVMLAKVFREGDSGAFLLDAARSPNSVTDQEGNFVIPNLEVNEYVIVVGDVFGEYVIITDPSTGKAATWQTEANEVLDVGDLEVEGYIN